jgi:hypothetical protein
MKRLSEKKKEDCECNTTVPVAVPGIDCCTWNKFKTVKTDTDFMLEYSLPWRQTDCLHHLLAEYDFL